MQIFLDLWKYFSKSEKTKHIRYSSLLLLVLSVVYGGYVHYEQPERTFVDIVYFLVTTTTTVGYGDISPTTQIGRILSIFYMLLGIVLLALLFGEFTGRIQRLAEKEKKGFIKMKDKVKLLIVGYPSEEKVKELVSQLRSEESFKNEKIVCITNTLDEKPEWFSEYSVIFKKGVASNSSVLEDININQVETALILAENSDDISSDDLSSSAVLVIEAINPEIRTIVEKVRKDDLLFKLAKADLITRVANASLLAQEIIHEGAIEFEAHIFNNNNGGTQSNFIVEKDILWKDLAVQLIMENKIPEGFKNPQQKEFNFMPNIDDLILSGATIKFRG